MFAVSSTIWNEKRKRVCGNNHSPWFSFSTLQLLQPFTDVKGSNKCLRVVKYIRLRTADQLR